MKRFPAFFATIFIATLMLSGCIGEEKPANGVSADLKELDEGIGQIDGEIAEIENATIDITDSELGDLDLDFEMDGSTEQDISSIEISADQIDGEVEELGNDSIEGGDSELADLDLDFEI